MLEDERKIDKLTIKEIILKGTILASIVTVPSLLSFLISWSILNDIVQAVVVGAVVHFIALGFSFKISKKLLIKHG